MKLPAFAKEFDVFNSIDILGNTRTVPLIWELTRIRLFLNNQLRARRIEIQKLTLDLKHLIT
jgi:hypothetical protein